MDIPLLPDIYTAIAQALPRWLRPYLDPTLLVLLAASIAVCRSAIRQSSELPANATIVSAVRAAMRIGLPCITRPQPYFAARAGYIS